MTTGNSVYIHLTVMAGVTYLVRMLPLAFLRHEVKQPFVRSFLYYSVLPSHRHCPAGLGRAVSPRPTGRTLRRWGPRAPPVAMLRADARGPHWRRRGQWGVEPSLPKRTVSMSG